MTHGNAYPLFHEATRWFREEQVPEVHPARTPGCACCRRVWAEVEDALQAVAYRYSSGTAVEWVCTTCYTPRLGMSQTLGVERLAGGNADKPVGAKLGMLPGSGGVVTPAAELHLALPPGFMTKFEDGRMSRAGRLHQKRPLELLLDLLIDGSLSEMSRGFLFVEVWGRKADVLMGNLKLSRSLREVWCNTESGSRCLDLQACLETAKRVNQEGLTRKAEKSAFWKPLVQAARGQRDASALKKWASQIDDPQGLIDLMPLDPYDRLRLPTIMRELLPLIEEGKL